MKKSVICILFSLLSASPSYASWSSIYAAPPSDELGAPCWTEPPVAGLISIQITVRLIDQPASLAAFRINVDPAVLPLILSHGPLTSGVTGDPFTTGIEVPLACTTDGVIPVYNLSFFATGDGSIFCPNSWIEIAPDDQGRAGVFDCNGNSVTTSTCWFLVLNPVDGMDSILCDGLGTCEFRTRPGPHVPGECTTVPAAESTWGRIKALYE